MPLTLRVNAELSTLSTVRQFVEEAGARLRVPRQALDSLILAADEVVTNIIQHGYRGRPGDIELALLRQSDAVILTVRDQAPPFDPTRLPDTDLTLPWHQRPEGGLGVYLVRRSVDVMAHAWTDEGGNQLTLIKKTTEPPSPDPH